MKVDWCREKDILIKLIEDNTSYEEIGRRYGVTGKAVKKAAKQLGIPLKIRRKINLNEHFNKNRCIVRTCLNCGREIIQHPRNIFCSNKCQREYEYKEYIKRWKNGEENGIISEYALSRNIRRYLFDKYDKKCQLCGWGEENPYTHTIPLEVHHIDGDYTNNREENLQLLCPNCHSLTETIKSHNKNGRKGRKKYK